MAAYHRGDVRHREVVRILARQQRKLLSPFVLAELDYVVTKRVGAWAADRVLRDVSRGTYELAPFDISDVGRAHQFVRQYECLDVGLADASIAVLAERYECHHILTLDQRHFRALVAYDGASFHLLPSDDR